MLRTSRLEVFLFFFKQKTAYEMRISDWSSDVCSSDLITHRYFAKCLTDAVREKRIHENVATQLDAPRKAVSKRKSLTADEATTLLMATASDPVAAEIGRASCRERVCQYV